MMKTPEALEGSPRAFVNQADYPLDTVHTTLCLPSLQIVLEVICRCHDFGYDILGSLSSLTLSDADFNECDYDGVTIH